MSVMIRRAIVLLGLATIPRWWSARANRITSGAPFERRGRACGSEGARALSAHSARDDGRDARGRADSSVHRSLYVFVSRVVKHTLILGSS